MLLVVCKLTLSHLWSSMGVRTEHGLGDWFSLVAPALAVVPTWHHVLITDYVGFQSAYGETEEEVLEH